MQYPSFMTEQRRWMVRPADRGKLPRSPFWQCPVDYKPLPGKEDRHWAYQWQNSAVWGTFEDALNYWACNSRDIVGVNYALHPTGENHKHKRLVCLDFDNAIDERGNLDPVVAATLQELDTYVELSMRKLGLHAFVFVDCETFKNATQIVVGDCNVDILCSAQVATTGNTYQAYTELRQAPFELINSLRVKAKTSTTNEGGVDWWGKVYEGISLSSMHLAHRMETWKTCYRSSKGSTLGGGGDAEFFKAACCLMRYGVVGWEADALLQLISVDPINFTEEERRHKLECAWRETKADGTFNTESVEATFPDTPTPPSKSQDEVFGFKYVPLHELELMDLSIEFIVDKIFVDKEPMFIGGREKSQKTNIAADLCYSLASGHPFLGKFNILQKRKVVFFTAEIGFPAAKNLFDRIRKAKGFEQGQVRNVGIVDSVPSFGLRTNLRAVAGLRACFSIHNPQVAVFDPLYLGMGGVSISDMNEIGEILRKISAVCREFDVWPIFCHHACKDRNKEYQPMELGDFYGAGVSAFARQWLLVSHAEPFANGRTSLYARMGGSAAGDCGLWRINIDEGMPDEIVDRTWIVDVQDEKEVTQEGGEKAIVEALQYHGMPESVKTLAEFAGIEIRIARAVLTDMVKANKGVTTKGGKFQLEGLNNEEL